MPTSEEEEKTPFTPLAILVIGFVFVYLGVRTLQREGIRGLGTSSQVILFLGILSIAGLCYVIWGMKTEFQQNGPIAAIDWVMSHEIADGTFSESRSPETTDKVPPPSENKKNRIKLDRANRECECCEKESDLLEIHHIRPRASGGTNRPSNLIALCPECHRKADRSVYSQSELRYKIKGKNS